MNPILKPFYEGQEQKYPKNLEANFSRVMGRILELWGTHALDGYLSELMIDTKGGRQGFPPAVISELLILSMVHDKFMAVQDASARMSGPMKVFEQRWKKSISNTRAKDFSTRWIVVIHVLSRYSFKPKSI
jgi:hypothetical protein